MFTSIAGSPWRVTRIRVGFGANVHNSNDDHFISMQKSSLVLLNSSRLLLVVHGTVELVEAATRQCKKVHLISMSTMFVDDIQTFRQRVIVSSFFFYPS